MIHTFTRHLRVRKAATVVQQHSSHYYAQHRHFSSAPTLPTVSCADVITIPLYSDNYCYLLIDRHSKKAAVVDPGSAEEVIQVIERYQMEQGISLTTILCTHKHDDHVGGNTAIKRHFPNVEIIGTGYEAIPALDRAVYHEDTFSIGSLQVHTLHTPCHTRGHVCFYVSRASGSGHDKPSRCDQKDGGAQGLTCAESQEVAPILFSGDTLFAGGCGRFFEGTGRLAAAT